MKRYYYLSKDLAETARFEQKLVNGGLDKSQIHVYGVKDSDAEKHSLNPVLSVFKSDLIHYLFRGLIIGALLSLMIVFALYLFNVPHLFVFGAVAVVLVTGFVTWEAGLIGLHKVNYKFFPLQKFITNTNHIVFVDVEDQHVPLLMGVQEGASQFRPVAVGSSLVNPFQQKEFLLR